MPEPIARVWPGRVAEENNLLAQIAALRKTLGPERELLRTVAGHGYRLCAPLRKRANPLRQHVRRAAAIAFAG